MATTTLRVRDRLADLSRSLLTRFLNFENVMHSLLEYSQAGEHMTFTPHGLSHVRAVEQNYDWLLGADDIEGLNATECFVLLCATLLHDALMIPRQTGDESRARETHATEPPAFLSEHAGTLGINDHEAHAVAEVVRAHSVWDLAKIEDRWVIGSEEVDLRKLGAILSMADLCHADYTRAPKIVFEYLKFDEESEWHWTRHLQISGITRSGNEIVLSALVFSDKGREAVDDFAKGIETQLALVRPYFSDILQPITRVTPRIERNPSATVRDLKMQANVASILDILIGQIYQRSDVFIRELVQNGLDASYLTMARAMKKGDSAEPAVIVSSCKDGGSTLAVRVDDTGAGMTIQEIERSLLTIGGSATQEELRRTLRAALDRDPIATFGIGILSTLAVSRSVEIYTKPDVSPGVMFTLTGPADNIVTSEWKDTGPPGTSIVVNLLPDAQQLDARESFAHYFRLKGNVPVRYAEYNLVDWDAMDRSDFVTRGLVAGRTPPEFEGGKTAHVADVSGERYRGWIWVDPAANNFASERTGEVTILNDGIFVVAETADRWLPPQFKNCSALLSVSPQALNLTVSRDGILQDNKRANFAREVGGRATRLIQALAESGRRPARQTAPDQLTQLTIAAAIISAAEPGERNGLAVDLGPMLVQVLRDSSREWQSLKELAEGVTGDVYIAYPPGPFVEHVGTVDGREVYEKESGLTDLQATLLAKRGKTVVYASRSDIAGRKILEYEALQAFFRGQGIEAVDLTADNVVEGTERSRGVSRQSREWLGAHVKFVDIPELGDRRSWKVGDEVWLNLAHSSISIVYEILNLDEAHSAERQALVRILLRVLTLDLCASVDLIEERLVELI